MDAQGLGNRVVSFRGSLLIFLVVVFISPFGCFRGAMLTG